MINEETMLTCGKPTNQLRFSDGKLEQLWECELYNNGNPNKFYSWLEVEGQE